MANSINLDIAQKADIICRRGDTFTLTLTLTDSNGTAIELATNDYQFLMQVRNRRRNSGADGLILGTSGTGVQGENNFEVITVTDLGVATITATATTMRAVSPGTYVYDIQYDVDGTHTTIMYGSFKVIDDVAEAV